jgi:hypothetical protein
MISREDRIAVSIPNPHEGDIGEGLLIRLMS